MPPIFAKSPCIPLVLALGSLAGCKGCESGAAGGGASAAREVQDDRAHLLGRMSSRKLDRDKVYPQDAEGNTLCAADVDCFVLQAERCAPAVLEVVQDLSGFGLTQQLQARYRISGRDGSGCKVSREVLAVAAKFDPAAAAVLEQRGKSAQEIAKIESGAVDKLVASNSATSQCVFSPNEALEAALDIAENRYDAPRWRTACERSVGTPPRVGIAAPEDESPAAEGGGDAPGAAAEAKADQPAAQRQAPPPAPAK